MLPPELLALDIAELGNHTVAPRTVEALGQLMGLAHQKNWTVIPSGYGSKLHWGEPSRPPQWIVRTCFLDQVIDHAASDLTVTVQAGVTVRNLQQILAQKGQFWPVDPLYPDQASVGGVIATADTGSWRFRYGSVRDLVLGLEMIRADGERVKAGGRVVKNVAGYDLMKLLTGSYGTLGILTSVTLRLFPLPPRQQQVWISGSLELLIPLVQLLLRSTLTPAALDWIQTPNYCGLWIAFHGFPEAVAVHLGQLAGLAQGLTLDLQPPDLTAQVRQQLSQAPLLVKVGLLPAQVGTFLHQARTQDPMSSFWITASGLGYGTLVPQAIPGLRACAHRQGGFMSLLTATPSLKAEYGTWDFQGNTQGLMAKIKKEFDPRHILNPGCLG